MPNFLDYAALLYVCTVATYYALDYPISDHYTVAYHLYFKRLINKLALTKAH